jgi:ParB/RepB/Spo0J family partition protein
MTEREPYPQRDIHVADVKIGDRLRLEDNVDDLLESLPKLGLLNPIVVSEKPGRSGYGLVAGRRRLLAARKLGWQQIPATIMPDGEQTKLAEVIENLHRKDLTAFQRAEHLVMWARHLEGTKQAATPTEAHQRAVAKTNDKLGNVSETVSTTSLPTAAAIIAPKLGATERTVREDIRIARDLAPEAAQAIRGTPLEDNRRALQQVSRLPKQEQVAAVKERLPSSEEMRQRARDQETPEQRAASREASERLEAERLADRISKLTCRAVLIELGKLIDLRLEILDGT